MFTGKGRGEAALRCNPLAGFASPRTSWRGRTYSPVAHRHPAEVIQELGLDPEQPGLHFSITSVGIVRGALATCHCLLNEDLDERAAWQCYRDDHGKEPFVRLVRVRRGILQLPGSKILAGANYCDIGFVADPGQRRLVVISAIDNLMKGAAGKRRADHESDVRSSRDPGPGVSMPASHLSV